MMPGAKPVRVTAKGLTVLTKQGYNRTIEADSIVTALPLAAEQRTDQRF